MTIALVGRKESGWLRAVAARCARECVRLDLESVLTRGALTVADGSVDWDGFALLEADAVLLERAVFAWPQPGSGQGELSAHGEREARALLLSALWTAAETVPVLEHPRFAHLAVAPPLALELCAGAGCAVQPWSLGSRPAAQDERVWMDPGGSELRYAPRRPEPGRPAFAPEPFEGECLVVLAIDGRAVAARRHADAAAWGAAEHEALVPAPEIPEGAAWAAVRAQEALGLAWAEVVLRDAEGEHALCHLRAEVDFGRWESEHSGTVSAAVAALLESRIASS